MTHPIKTLAKLTRPQLQAIVDKAEIKATGTFTPPPIDLAAIKSRADELDPASQLKADLYLLIFEVERLQNGRTPEN